jgi:hypothetical protein
MVNNKTILKILRNKNSYKINNKYNKMKWMKTKIKNK